MSNNKRGIKYLIVGSENTGKTTLASHIEDAMHVYIDEKQYPFDIPHYKVGEYKGHESFKNELITKIKAYKDKFDQLPTTIVFDTVTALYTEMYKFANDNYKGYDVHNSINRNTLDFNKMIESLLIGRGINVVILAHVIYDQGQSKYVVPATGNFKDTGSWLGVVDNASYLHVVGNERWIAHNEIKYPCRTTLDDMKSTRIDDYDIVDHISKLEEIADRSEKNAL